MRKRKLIRIKRRTFSDKKERVIGGATSAVLGARAGYGIGTAGVKVLRKISPRYDELAERRLDQLKMAEGEMTKKEFKKKKHYKK